MNKYNRQVAGTFSHRSLLSYHLLLALAILFVSCDSNDDSTLPNGTLPTITIADFPEDGYNVVSYQGNHLKISPDITTGYSDGQLSFHWYLVNDQAENVAYSKKKDYAWEPISEERKLDYEVNLSPGKYFVCLDVTAENGDTSSKQTTLLVTTDFTEGYYILKQTADGNSELDVFRAKEDRLMENLFHATTGSSLEGAPVTLSMAFNHSYIDKDSNEPTGGNIATVTTQSGHIRCLSTNDLSTVLSNGNLLYDTMESTERPYMIFSGMMSNFMISNEGIRSQANASFGGGSGCYGIAGGAGGSRFVVLDDYGYTTVAWGASTHTLYYVDYNGGSGYFDDPNYPVNDLTNWECLACGCSSRANTLVFLLQNTATGARQLVYVSTSFMDASVSKIVTVDRSSHLASGSIFTVSNASASFFYTVDGNRIYGYDLNSGEEQEIQAEGIGNETITYISDKYLNRGRDNYFIVGTQSGDQYTLRFYNQLGGKPDGAPVHTVTGTGKVVSIKYTNTTISAYTLPALQD